MKHNGSNKKQSCHGHEVPLKLGIEYLRSIGLLEVSISQSVISNKKAILLWTRDSFERRTGLFDDGFMEVSIFQTDISRKTAVGIIAKY